MVFAVPLDQFDEIGRELGKVGQRFMDDHRFGGGGSGSGAPGRALGRHAFALDQEDGLVLFARQDAAVAFDEHDGWNIRVERGRRKIYIALLETTLQTHNKPDGVEAFIHKPHTDGGRSV